MSEVAPWTRPEPVPFPCVRQRHVGRRPLEVAGGDAPPAYVVQELPGDRHEEAVRLMADVFLREEPITSCFGLRDDPEAFAELQEVWRLVLSERISLCALVEQPDGSPGPLAAFNMLMVVRPGEKFELKNEKLADLLKTVKEVEALVQPDVFERFGVPECLSAVGLVVAREHRGQGLGEQLLRARWPLGRALGLRATATMFTGAASQLLARRAGFQALAEAVYADQPHPAFHTITSSRSMIFMAAALE
ncbi:uncharacterized protein LOC124595990 isoform X2 [Schistocerca americana]|uniref:uncharacterized protein LOC124595990 isoform X2 n=1 Tax=Schistocerca americana TaxID=7009 RepID=UPI001F4F22E8|nr:uncharacterized protein LOC124595990 isoform X2 [Schistocerca americana]